MISKLTETLVKYKISIFGIDVIYKTLEQVFMEILNKKNHGISDIF